MLLTANRIFVGFLLLLVLAGALTSIIYMVFDLQDSKTEAEHFSSMEKNASLYFAPISRYAGSNDSPYYENVTIHTPPLTRNDIVYMEVYSGGELISETDCLQEIDYQFEEYTGNTSVECSLLIPYYYQSNQDYHVYAIFHRGDNEYFYGPVSASISWVNYEKAFWIIFSVLSFMLVMAYLVIIIPLLALALYLSLKAKHETEQSGEYTIRSLFHPFEIGKTMLSKVNSFLLSPYFWGIEGFGILIILVFMFLASDSWKNGIASGSFLISGIAAFMIPFIWCVVAWYADFREREPLRVMVTFFLWGCFAALLAIGVNSVSDHLLETLGLTVLVAFIVAPVVEEVFKGAGLTLLSEHHEYDSLEDGIAYGFVIGMGFSFIEDWLYLLHNPVSASILGWFLLFVMRSILFSTNHGLFTAITGGIIGWLREKGFCAPALGLIPGVMIAATFHAIHNSGELLASLLGVGGLFTWCCLLLPLFDYGGLVALILIFLIAVFRKRKR